MYFGSGVRPYFAKAGRAEMSVWNEQLVGLNGRLYRLSRRTVSVSEGSVASNEARVPTVGKLLYMSRLARLFFEAVRRMWACTAKNMPSDERMRVSEGTSRRPAPKLNIGDI